MKICGIEAGGTKFVIGIGDDLCGIASFGPIDLNLNS